MDDAQAESIPTHETQDARFFALTELPPLSSGHDRRIPYVVNMLTGEAGVPYFDVPHDGMHHGEEHWQHMKHGKSP